MSGQTPSDGEPTPPEELTGKDEIDEADEMDLSGDDLVGDEPQGPS